MSISVGTISGVNYLNYLRSTLSTPPSSDQVAFFQKDILTKGQYYILEIKVHTIYSGVTIRVGSFENIHYITTTGKVRIIDKAITDTLIIEFLEPVLTANPTSTLIEYIKIRPLPTYSLIDCINDTIVQTLDPSEITQGEYVEGLETFYDNYIKLSLDLSGLNDGIYYIEYTDEGVTYRTEPFNLKLIWDCTIQLTWTGVNSDAFGFNYSTLDYIQSLRVDGKLWKAKFEYDKNENFKDSKGNVLLTYVRAVASDTLSVREMPEYCHRALWLGLKHDSFNIDGAQYTYIADDYPVQWRKSSKNAPVELEVQKQDQNLTNSNCN